MKGTFEPDGPLWEAFCHRGFRADDVALYEGNWIAQNKAARSCLAAHKSACGRLPASRAGFQICYSAFALAIIAIFRRAQHDLALAVPVGDRQGLQDHVEAVARLVGKGRANRKPAYPPRRA